MRQDSKATCAIENSGPPIERVSGQYQLSLKFILQTLLMLALSLSHRSTHALQRVHGAFNKRRNAARTFFAFGPFVFSVFPAFFFWLPLPAERKGACHLAPSPADSSCSTSSWSGTAIGGAESTFVHACARVHACVGVRAFVCARVWARVWHLGLRNETE